MSLLAIDNLCVTIGGTRLLDGVSLSLAPGQALGVVGESGCGKSMTALAVMGLLPRDAQVSGSIRLQGQELLGLPERQLCSLRGNRMAMVFQEPATALSPVISIGAQVAEPLRLHRRISRAEALQQAEALLDRVGLPPSRFAPSLYPHQLSGGQRQRVMIAMAMACAPALLIADEPTTALDVTLQAQILTLLTDLVTERGMGLLLISHDLAVVAQTTQQVAVMYAGKVVEQGAAPDLFQRLAHPYTRGLFQSRPSLGHRGRLPTIPGTVPDPDHRPAGCAFAARCGRVMEHCHTQAPPLLADVACFNPWPADAPLLPPQAPNNLSRPAPSPGVVLTVEDLIRDYPLPRAHPFAARRTVRALQGVSLHIKAGQTLGLVGESGSGKSTLARCIMGLDTPQGGTIRLQGLDPFNPATRRTVRRVAQMVFQDPTGSLDPRQTVARIVAEPLQGLRLGPPTGWPAQVMAALGEVGLGPSLAERYPHQLSGGQRQRVAIARALITRPALIVADEPVSALDVSVQAQVLNLLLDLQDSHGVAYLFISHDLAVVRRIADDVAVLYAGQIVETGPAEALFSRPAHPYTAALLAAIPQPGHLPARLPGQEGTTVPRQGCAFAPRCPQASSLCQQTAPALRDIGDRQVACHSHLA